jgi:catechol 2,3-dioxygenase-like lactoylglutathione lyase family enzyme
MIKDITGLHHVTSMAGDANANNAFFTRTLGLRRIKKTVNFDAPEVYHLYFGDGTGTPGSVMTTFPSLPIPPPPPKKNNTHTHESINTTNNTTNTTARTSRPWP